MSWFFGCGDEAWVQARSRRDPFLNANPAAGNDTFRNLPAMLTNVLPPFPAL
jgi:hypothetical protein